MADVEYTPVQARGAVGTQDRREPTDADPDTVLPSSAERDRRQSRQKATPHLTVAERAARGKAAREVAARSAHGEWEPASDRRDPVELLEEQAASRVRELVPIRYGRILVSPFTFFRGAAYSMAADLAGAPRTGLDVQLCGDAHLSNFGGFAAPDRRLVFSINDFDEMLPGPFEWDVKRLVASFVPALGAEGRRRGQRRHARLDPAHDRPRRERSAVPAAQRGRGIGARALPGQERLRQARPAGREGPATHAGSQRHHAGLDANHDVGRRGPGLLRSPAVGRQGLGARRDHGPSGDDGVRRVLRPALARRTPAPGTRSRSRAISAPATASTVPWLSFAEAYADQNERDYGALQDAVATGALCRDRALNGGWAARLAGLGEPRRLVANAAELDSAAAISSPSPPRRPPARRPRAGPRSPGGAGGRFARRPSR